MLTLVHCLVRLAAKVLTRGPRWSNRGCSTFPRYLSCPLLVLGAGVGMATPPTTSAIMMSAPDEKQGVASAVNDVTREVGGALGIALAGSILAGSYSHAIAPALTPVPQALRGPASESLAQALAIADRLGPQGTHLAEASKTAFVDGVNSSYLVMAAIAAVAAIVIPLFAPGRDGRRLRVARRLLGNWPRRGPARG